MVDAAVWPGFMGTGTMIIVDTSATLDDDPALTVDARLTEATGAVPLAVDVRVTAEVEATGAIPLTVEAEL